ncbi:DinB family protein [Hufsiella ginkgonis]|uniref:Damage-inducible protein DinB n=1 Tax=Hufsiella ginkgonis TaxID=2695274 RepID=A0A7K1Y1N1_9SPHI|nr:DinB family protein [Hufsiella ginkgonis]MXV17131.1 hypothetical protein [Hufsiella ginkgonis]
MNADLTVATNSVVDIIYHVTNHSTYHRGQVATQFRLHEIACPATDYIWLKRNGLL